MSSHSDPHYGQETVSQPNFTLGTFDRNSAFYQDWSANLNHGHVLIGNRFWTLAGDHEAIVCNSIAMLIYGTTTKYNDFYGISVSTQGVLVQHKETATKAGIVAITSLSEVQRNDPDRTVGHLIEATNDNLSKLGSRFWLPLTESTPAQ